MSPGATRDDRRRGGAGRRLGRDGLEGDQRPLRRGRATSERVRAVIDELGYESSLVAQSLRSRRTNVIGMLVADIEPFSAELLKGAGGRYPRTGYELIVYSGCGHGRTRSGGSAATSPASAARSPTAIDPRHAEQVDVSTARPSSPSTTRRPSTLPTRRRRQPQRRRRRDRCTCRARPSPHRVPRRRPDLESARLREAGYRRRWGRRGCPRPALVRVGGYRRSRRRTRARRAAGARAAPDRDLRGQRRDGDPDDSRRARWASRADDGSRSSASTLPESALAEPPLTTDRPVDPADGLSRPCAPDPAHRRRRRTPSRSRCRRASSSGLDARDRRRALTRSRPRAEV